MALADFGSSTPLTQDETSLLTSWIYFKSWANYDFLSKNSTSICWTWLPILAVRSGPIRIFVGFSRSIPVILDVLNRLSNHATYLYTHIYTYLYIVNCTECAISRNQNLIQCYFGLFPISNFTLSLDFVSEPSQKQWFQMSGVSFGGKVYFLDVQPSIDQQISQKGHLPA